MLAKKIFFILSMVFCTAKKTAKPLPTIKKKMLPRLPLVEDVHDFWTFNKAGRKMTALHLD